MPKLYVITGPSGVGKTSVALKLIAELPHLKKLITCTTRAPREGEVPDVDYHFFSHAAFEQMIERGEMFEWAKVYDQYYGNRTADLRELFAQGSDVMMVVDVQGARTIKKNRPEALIIFLTVPSLDDLEARIRSRGHITKEELARRLNQTREELKFASKADFVVSNPQGKLKETVASLRQTIMKSA